MLSLKRALIEVQECSDKTKDPKVSVIFPVHAVVDDIYVQEEPTDSDGNSYPDLSPGTYVVRRLKFPDLATVQMMVDMLQQTLDFLKERKKKEEGEDEEAPSKEKE